MRKNVKQRVLTILITTALAAGLLSGCGSTKAPVESDMEDLPEEWEEEGAEEDFFENTGEEFSDTEQGELPDETVEKAMSGKGAVTAFLGDPFYNGQIKNADDALEAVYSVVKEIGGDASTEFDYEAVDETEDGVTYYTFRQTVGDLSVYGAAAKLIADKNGQAIGLVSSIIPELEAPPRDLWEISAGEAEESVKKEWNDSKLKIYSKATEQTLIPVEEGAEAYQYVWVVYSDSVFDGTDGEYKLDAGYTAHYVTYDGEYLYCIGVTDIGNEEALSGSAATFAFADMESDVWSGTVKTLNGKKKEIEVPIMTDRNTGEQYLGDVKRKILCASHPEFEYEETLSPLVAKNGRWDDEAMITYYNYINVYDLYETSGWVGPDGIKTPSLLLMGAVNEDGSPMDNAAYVGKKQGFHTFVFDTASPYGESMDIVGHEFTHCVTGTLMTTNLYLNDYGAINEGMSDILGNLTAIMMDETDIPFTIGDALPEDLQRSMKDPNLHQQPGFVWDKYYVPAVAEPNDDNDQGGVHINSSLLNYISYKLNDAGMEPEEEFYFWMNVARAMTPRTDYEQMAELLPWVMNTFGQKAYIKALEDAINQTGISSHELPESPADGLALVSLALPDSKALEQVSVTASFLDLNTGSMYTNWPEAGKNVIYITLPKGDYLTSLQVMIPEAEEPVHFAFQEGRWNEMGPEIYEKWLDTAGIDESIALESGDLFDLETENLSGLFAGLKIK
ncbi:MAG: M4 family metallopeptidase [Lachnospiraceae bacterium]|nr:M4 family metallopeptidase [Lachnospiraceae bacterium]